jgi:hypothetical protein
VISSRLDHAGITRRAPGERDGGLPAGRAVSRYRSQPDLLGELAAGLGIPPQILADRAARPAAAGARASNGPTSAPPTWPSCTGRAGPARSSRAGTAPRPARSGTAWNKKE